MPDASLQQTREQLTQALSQITALSGENAKLKARLVQLKNLDPDRIIKLAEQVTAELRRSEERSDQLLRVIGELREKNKKLEDLVLEQQTVIEDFQMKMQKSIDEHAALDDHSDGGDSDLHDEEDMTMVKSKIASLTDSVATVQGLLANLREAPLPAQLLASSAQGAKGSTTTKSHEALIQNLLDSL